MRNAFQAMRRRLGGLFARRPDVYLVKFDAYWHPYIPYAFLYIGSRLKQARFSYRILHNTSQEDVEADLERFAREVVAARPAWVGLSVITGRCAHYSARFSRMIKEQSDIPIVWGGIHPTLLPEQCLQQDYVDYVILGEGEDRAVAFTQRLLDGGDFADMDGVGYKRDGQLFVNPPQGKVDVETLDIDWDHNLWPYVAQGGLSYIASRGCPYRCDFCVNQALDNRRWRPFPKDRVLSDIAYLKRRYDLRYIHLNDDNFFVDRDRAFDILAQCGLRWFAETRVNYITTEFAQQITDLGTCDKLMAGGESGVDRILQRIHKDHTTAQMLRATDLIGRHRIPSTWSFIVGMPAETYADIRQTFDFMKKLEDIAGFRFCKPGLYLPYPGTPMYDQAVGMGFLPPARPEDWIICERYRGSKKPTDDGIVYPWIDYDRLLKAMELMVSQGYEGIDAVLTDPKGEAATECA